ncbi:MAG: DUF1080 domain-containing protein [Mariniblastus sp.]
MTQLFSPTQSVLGLSRFSTAFTFAVMAFFGCLTVVGQDKSNDMDYQVQGEYSGTLEADGQEFKFGIQIIALGKGKFTGVAYFGGLPGDGWNGDSPKRIENVSISEDEDKILKLTTDDGEALVSDGVATITDAAGNVMGRLKRIVRKSSTLGKSAPKNGIVLFDGTSVEQWEFRGKPGRMTDDGLLKQGTASKEKFQSHKIHIEFLLPFHPEARGQQRSNSGIYVQGRYEVQMLDSFGLSGEHNECGGIYKIRKPNVNMCYPPMQWQTYDIEFHAAMFEGEKKVKNAWVTVAHNGVTIHEKVELPNSTTASPLKDGATPGFVYLQDHGQEVRYRNIWVEPIVEEDNDAGEDATKSEEKSK